jgi:hypothetical protein
MAGGADRGAAPLVILVNLFALGMALAQRILRFQSIIDGLQDLPFAMT